MSSRAKKAHHTLRRNRSAKGTLCFEQRIIFLVREIAMQSKPKPQPPRKIELYLLELESATEYLHEIEQSLNTSNINRPAQVKFTDNVELALKFPSKNIASAFQGWINNYFKIETKIVLLTAKAKVVMSDLGQ